MSEDKIELFRKEIMSKASAERDAILKEAEEAKRQELDREQNRQLEEIYQKMQAEIAAIKVENARIISAESRKLREQLYRQREQYLSELMARARVELVAFTATPAYAAYLTRTAQQLAEQYPPEPDAVLELREEDMVHAKSLEAAYGGKVRVCTQPIAIGGMRMVNQRRGASVDCTLESALEKQKEWFYENSHLSIE